MAKGYILTDKEVRWAWHKRKEGYSVQEIADALYVEYKTLRNALMRKYGSIGAEERPKLVYREDDA